jgi:hypothetical protein
MGTSSLPSAASTLRSAASSMARSSSRQPEKSSRAPWFLSSSRSSSKLQARFPTSGTSAPRFWPISVASISSWMIFASAGIVWPKRIRKSSSVPASRMQSIRSRASRRDRFRNSGSSGDTVPRPMPLV